jgi:hypothetical protein
MVLPDNLEKKTGGVINPGKNWRFFQTAYVGGGGWQDLFFRNRWNLCRQ